MGTVTLNFYKSIMKYIKLAKKISHKVPAWKSLLTVDNCSDQICKTILATTFLNDSTLNAESTP